MVKLFLYSATVCAFFLSCTRGKEILKPQKTIIAGVVENFSDDANVIIVNYCDEFSDENRFAQNLDESNGRFHTAHDYLFAQNLTLRFGGKFINLFVNPGDSVFVKIDAGKIRSNFDGAVTFSGDNADLNKEMAAWSNYGYARNIPEFDLKAPSEELLASLRSHLDASRDSIAAYSQRAGMSPFMKKWAFVDHKFTVANYLLSYDNPDSDKWALFTDPLFDVFNEDNFQTMYFPFHLGTCVRALTQSDPEIGRLAGEEKFGEAMRLMMQRLQEKAPRGIVRDAMMFSTIKDAIDYYPGMLDVVQEIREAFSQEVFVNMLAARAEVHEQAAKLSETESKLDGVVYLDGGTPVRLSDVATLTYLSQRYEGKVMYIDIWATWCGPCIEEFKSAAVLHKYFEGRDVVFVNLCLSSPFEDWQPGVVKHNVEGENYYFDDNATAQFMGEYNLNGYPSYIIVGRGGEVYNPAPRPSNTEAAVERIESLLK